MSPAVGSQPLTEDDILKVKNTPYVYRNETWEKPLADDFMYAFKYNFPLPTHGQNTDILGITADDEKSKQVIAEDFLKKLEQIIQAGDSKKFADLFLDTGML